MAITAKSIAFGEGQHTTFWEVDPPTRQCVSNDESVALEVHPGSASLDGPEGLQPVLIAAYID